MPLPKALELVAEPAADAKRVCLQALLLQYIENRKPHGAGNRISAKRAEKFHAVVERSRNFASRDDGCERKCVSDGLAEHDDVGHDALRFESPEMSAQPAE